jgi:hypothetical protein
MTGLNFLQVPDACQCPGPRHRAVARSAGESLCHWQPLTGAAQVLLTVTRQARGGAPPAARAADQSRSVLDSDCASVGFIFPVLEYNIPAFVLRSCIPAFQDWPQIDQFQRPTAFLRCGIDCIPAFSAGQKKLAGPPQGTGRLLSRPAPPRPASPCPQAAPPPLPRPAPPYPPGTPAPAVTPTNFVMVLAPGR